MKMLNVKMKMKLLARFATGLLMFAMVGTANATPIELTWTTEISGYYGGSHSVDWMKDFASIGEKLTVTITVDNGGSSTLSQSWSPDDVVSYRLDGASGWWLETDFLGDIRDDSHTTFSTDAMGNVIETGDWETENAWFIGSFYQGATIGGWFLWDESILWLHEPLGGRTYGSYAYLLVTNGKKESQKGSNWTATAASPVPEPATMLLFGTGLAALVGTRIRRKKQ